MSDAIMAFGMQILIGDGEESEEFTAISEVGDISGFERIIEMVDVSSHSSTGHHRERKPDWFDTTPLAFSINYIIDDESHVALVAAHDDGLEHNFQVQWPDDEAYQFPAVVSKFDKPGPKEGALIANVELTVTGQPTEIGS